MNIVAGLSQLATSNTVACVHGQPRVNSVFMNEPVLLFFLRRRFAAPRPGSPFGRALARIIMNDPG